MISFRAGVTAGILSASEKPIDPFAEFPPQRAARLYEEHTGSTPLFAGKAICTDVTPDCPGSYGAAVFSIEEIERM